MNYQNIASAVEHFVGLGYVYMHDVPWMVSRDAYYATRPPGAIDVSISMGPTTRHPVASGEQGFIQMMLDGQPLKKAICVTPCYRVERWDALHLPYFMKAELINADDVSEANLIHMIHDAMSFFEVIVGDVRVIRTGDRDFDIVEKSTRIELGSYGIRELVDREKNTELSWIYGTACAEPRLSDVMKRLR